MRLRLLLWATVLLGTAACGGGQAEEPATTAPIGITVTSTAFRDDALQAIDARTMGRGRLTGLFSR